MSATTARQVSLWSSNILIYILPVRVDCGTLIKYRTFKNGLTFVNLFLLWLYYFKFCLRANFPEAVSKYCFPRKLKLGSQHTYGAAQNCLSVQFQRIPSPLLVSSDNHTSVNTVPQACVEVKGWFPVMVRIYLPPGLRPDPSFSLQFCWVLQTGWLISVPEDCPVSTSQSLRNAGTPPAHPVLFFNRKQKHGFSISSSGLLSKYYLPAKPLYHFLM